MTLIRLFLWRHLSFQSIRRKRSKWHFQQITITQTREILHSSITVFFWWRHLTSLSGRLRRHCHHPRHQHRRSDRYPRSLTRCRWSPRYRSLRFRQSHRQNRRQFGRQGRRWNLLFRQHRRVCLICTIKFRTSSEGLNWDHLLLCHHFVRFSIDKKILVKIIRYVNRFTSNEFLDQDNQTRGKIRRNFGLSRVKNLTIYNETFRFSIRIPARKIIQPTDVIIQWEWSVPLSSSALVLDGGESSFQGWCSFFSSYIDLGGWPSLAFSARSSTEPRQQR